MIYFICSLMVTFPDGSRHTTDLNGYGEKFGSTYIINLERDADFKGVKSSVNLRSYEPFPGECHAL